MPMLETVKPLLKKAADAWQRQRDAAAATSEETPETWAAFGLDRRVRAQVQEAEDAGLLDPKLLDRTEARIEAWLIEQAGKYLDPVRDVIGTGLADSVFGNTDYRNRLDRQLATASGAVADLAVEEALVVAVDYATLLMTERHQTLRPAWPDQDARGASKGVR